MIVIPVLDLLDGQVVHAKLGDRKNYQPVVSTLCQSSDPLEVLDNLLTLYCFSTCYIADLNAIQGKGSQQAIIKMLLTKYPQLEFWIDGGFTNKEDVETAITLGITPVLGSENLTSVEHYQTLKASAHKQLVLSLDFKNDIYQGPLETLAKSTAWPERVIVMTLNRVGSNSGPDLDKLKKFKTSNPQTRIFAAGGVRYMNDIHELIKIGINGVLVASAFHSGSITTEDLETLKK